MGNIIDDMFTAPLMVAYSGLVNKEVEERAKEAGFDLVIESPLTVEKIKNIVFGGIEDKILKKRAFQQQALSRRHK